MRREASGAAAPGSSPCNLAPGKQECNGIDAVPYITRPRERLPARAVARFQAVSCTGSCQSGETTFLRRAFVGTVAYASLAAADVPATAMEGRRGFLRLYAPPVVLGEIQKRRDYTALGAHSIRDACSSLFT